jgi:hypothetical protein
MNNLVYSRVQQGNEHQDEDYPFELHQHAFQTRHVQSIYQMRIECSSNGLTQSITPQIQSV